MSHAHWTTHQAISIDYDYFSRHSYSGGMFSPFIPMPMPMPVPPVAGDAEVAPGAGGDADASSDIRDVGDNGGASYEWDGFEEGSAASGSQAPIDDLGGNLGGDFGATGAFEEFDDFGAAGEEVASGGLFELLKDFMSDE